MFNRRHTYGGVEVAAAAILTANALVGLAIALPFLMPGNDMAQAAFQYTWSVVSLMPRSLGWLLRLATVGSIIILQRAAFIMRSGPILLQDAASPEHRLRRATVIAGCFIGAVFVAGLIGGFGITLLIAYLERHAVSSQAVLLLGFPLMIAFETAAAVVGIKVGQRIARATFK